MKLSKYKTALVVIDMTNGWCSSDGHIARLGFDTTMCRRAVNGCETLIDNARKSDVQLIYTRHVYQEDFSDAGVIVDEIMPQLKAVKPASSDAWSNQIIDRLKPQHSDIVVEKNRYSAFYSRDFEYHLKHLEITDLVLCGVTTIMCVESTATDAAQRDYRTFVVSNATGDIELFRHEQALVALEFGFARIISVEDVQSTWTG